jgi:hypothetical protein
MPAKRLIHIEGDQTVDWFWHYMSEETRHSDERLRRYVRIHWMAGGVWLLESLIQQAVSGHEGVETRSAKRPEPEGDLKTYENPFNHSFAILDSYPTEGSRKNALRVKEYQGFIDRAQVPDEPSESDQYELELRKDDPEPEVIVVDDADLGFRAEDNRPHWENIIPTVDTGAKKPWVLLKISHNLRPGDFWHYIHKRIRDNANDWLAGRLVVVTAAARLRDAGAHISRDLSWERTAQDVLKELSRKNSPIRSLLDCQRLVVPFGPIGALLIVRENGDRPKTSSGHTLIFDPVQTEVNWEERDSRGRMFGYGSAICAGIVGQLIDTPSGPCPDLVKGVKAGLLAARTIHEEGFQEIAETKGQIKVCPNFYAAKEKVKDGTKGEFTSAIIPPWCDPASNPKKMVELSFVGLQHNDPDLVSVVRHGVDEIRGIPVGRFGDLVTVDRSEIEGLRAVKNLISRYQRDAHVGAKPLAVAVFGPPGSGKSFAVKALMSEGMKRLDFNLSQFNSPKEISGSLQKVGDTALEGATPVAFWDEFDTALDGKELGWLRYFLSPIEDGEFRQGESVYLVGQSIFVFAGGNFDSFESFKERASVPELATSKSRDFLSRLKGYINIPGLNSTGSGNSHLLRRAIFLNSLFKKYDIDAEKADAEVINAFLRVGEYLHGARSMEAILRMSRVNQGEAFRPDSLPSSKQLNLHVNGDDFLDNLHW